MGLPMQGMQSDNFSLLELSTQPQLGFSVLFPGKMSSCPIWIHDQFSSPFSFLNFLFSNFNSFFPSLKLEIDTFFFSVYSSSPTKPNEQQLVAIQIKQS